jgi:hypothetical protein
MRAYSGAVAQSPCRGRQKLAALAGDQRPGALVLGADSWHHSALFLTGALHDGWLWIGCAFAGTSLGLRLRLMFGVRD